MRKKLEHMGTTLNVKNQIQQDGHEVILLPNGKNIGIIDFQKSMVNMSIIADRGRSAFKNQHFIEFISLKIQYLEYYLKIYWVTKNPGIKILDEKNKKFFGTLISECRSFGFDKELIDRIDEFNKQRVLAIHKFLMGGTSESELESLCKENGDLANKLYNYVIDQCGVLITDLSKIPTDVGSMIVTRPKRNI